MTNCGLISPHRCNSKTDRAESTAHDHGWATGQRWTCFCCTCINPYLAYRLLCRGPGILLKFGPDCKQKVHLVVLAF